MEVSGKKLRIAVLNRNFSPTGGGAERYSIALVEQLAARHEIHVFSQQFDHHWPGVTYHRISTPFKRPRWVNQLWYATATWWATRLGFDLVHSHENTWHGQVQTVHVLPVRFNLFHGRTGWAWVGRCIKVATSPRLLAYLGLERLRFQDVARRCIVVTSASLRGKMESTYPATTRALQVLTPGVTMSSDRATAAMQQGARQRLGLPPVGHGILFVGNDYRKKGLGTLIQALAVLPDFAWLMVVGNAGQEAEFRAQAQAAGVTSRVFFLGVMNDVSDAYIAADCLAHPTHEDTFAMVVLEAMAHALPVVVSSEQYCGISGLLTPQVNALILQDPRDASALAAALLVFIQDPVTRQKISAAALAFASQYQWSTIALQQESIYYAASQTSRE